MTHFREQTVDICGKEFSVPEPVAYGLRAGISTVDIGLIGLLPRDVAVLYTSRAVRHFVCKNTFSDVAADLQRFKRLSAVRTCLRVGICLMAVLLIIPLQKIALLFTCLALGIIGMGITAMVERWLGSAGKHVIQSSVARWLELCTCPHCSGLLLGGQVGNGGSVACPHCKKYVLQTEISVNAPDLVATPRAAEIDNSYLLDAKRRSKQWEFKSLRVFLWLIATTVLLSAVTALFIVVYTVLN